MFIESFANNKQLEKDIFTKKKRIFECLEATPKKECKQGKERVSEKISERTSGKQEKLDKTNVKDKDKQPIMIALQCVNDLSVVKSTNNKRLLDNEEKMKLILHIKSLDSWKLTKVANISNSIL